MTDRLPPLAPEAMTEAQRAAVTAFEGARGHKLIGPFIPLSRSPDFLTAASGMGKYLRYKSSLPHKINEFVILMVARAWDNQVEWQIHQPIALKAGLVPAIADAIAQGRRPDPMPEDEAIAYDFSTELRTNKSVSDATYARALARFGEQGVVDMAGTNGYYALLAMVMNMARTPGVAGASAVLPKLR